MFSRGGSLLPSSYADARYIDTVVVSKADLENGLWAGDQHTMPQAPLTFEFVTAMVKGDSNNHWSIKGGDATTGALKTLYDGVRQVKALQCTSVLHDDHARGYG